MITPTKSLTGRICLVTGGSRGIGRAIAKMLLMEGAQVAICGRSQENVDRAVQELSGETGGKVEGKVADVKSHEQVGALFQFVDSRFGGLDVLVNNAGVGVFRPVADLTLDEWRSAIDTNLSGAFYCSREALFRFVTRGGGYIVNINSLAGANAFAGGAAYNASKFGLTGFTEAMMQDVRSDNVRVSTVMPGSVATGFGDRVATGFGDRVATGFGDRVATGFGDRVATGFGDRVATGFGDRVATGFGGSVATESRQDYADHGAEWKIWPEDVAEVVRMLLAMPTRTLVSRVEVRPAKTKNAPKR